MRPRNVLIIVAIVAALAVAGWWYRRPRQPRREPWPPPENAGDYAGPLTRPWPGYNPSKAPSRPWLLRPAELPPHTTYHTYAASTINGQHTDYLLYLPPGYDDPANAGRRYPVIYWLHGVASEPQYGSPFVDGLDAAIRARRSPPAIVVLPNGLAQSWYVDSVDGSQPVESVIINDLIPHIDSTWRTIADRRGRAIEGFSMGGWGAIRLAAKYPDRFCAATSVSGPFRAYESFGFHEPVIFDCKEAFYAEDPVTRLRRDAGRIRGAVRIRLMAGEKDWASIFVAPLGRRLDEWQIPHAVAIAPGAGHDTADIYQALGIAAFEFYAKVFEPIGR